MKSPKQKKKAVEKQQRKKKEHKDDVLDSALQDSFPASDPVSLTEPAPTDEPTTDRQRPQEEEEQPSAPGP